MPIKLSSYLWLRNNDSLPIIEDRYNEPGRFMEPKEKAALKKVIDEIDELHKGSGVKRNTEGFLGPNVVLTLGFPEIVGVSSDTKRSGELFHEIHKILKDHFVNVDIYRRLGRAFEELGITDINPELKIAIEYGTRNAEARSRGLYGPDIHGTICARVVIDQELRRLSGSKEKI